MKTVFIILIGISMNLTMFGQKVEKTQLGTFVIRNSDQSYILYEPTTIKNDTANVYLASKSWKNFNNTDRLKGLQIKDFLIDQDIKLYAKKVDLAEQRLINKNKLEQSLKIKNNGLTNTFMEIDKKYLKEENKILNEYQSLAKKFKEIENIGNLTDNSKSLKALDKMHRGLFGKTLVEIKSKPKVEVKSRDNKIQEVLSNEVKEAKPSLVTMVYKPAPIKIDERKPWEIEKTDSINVLLTYTPEKFQNYYGDIPFLTIESSIVKSGKEHLLNLKFIFSSRDVSKGYGFINKNDLLKIDFLKSLSIKLQAADNYSPTVEPYTGYTIYQTQYRFENKSDYKKLTTKHLDRIGVMWSLGFEEYPIYNLEFYFEG